MSVPNMPSSLSQPPPFISVVMTVFQAEEYLVAALESILAQTFSDWEMVIVDDGSTDRSRDILERYQQQDRRIRLILNEVNLGQTASLNRALEVCRGKWIARQDADDLSYPRRLESQVAFLEKHPEVVLLGTSGRIIDKQDKKKGVLIMPQSDALIRWSAPILNPFLHTAVIFSREVALRLGGYNTTYRIAQDYEFWSRMMQEGKVANLAEHLVDYRHLSSSLSKIGASQAFEEADQVASQLITTLYGERLTLEEFQTLSHFRSSFVTLTSKEKREERKRFWKLIQRLIKEVPMEGETARKQRTLLALFHFRMAGIFRQDHYILFLELLASFLYDGKVIKKWILSKKE
jgi:glycosyltransferase involved in cell wall biosynthesis